MLFACSASRTTSVSCKICSSFLFMQKSDIFSVLRRFNASPESKIILLGLFHRVQASCFISEHAIKSQTNICTCLAGRIQSLQPPGSQEAVTMRRQARQLCTCTRSPHDPGVCESHEKT